MRFGVVMAANVFYPSIGGAQSQILRLSQKLRERDVEALVVTRRHHQWARFEEVEGVPTYRVGVGDGHKAIAALSFLAGAVKVLYEQRRRYQVLHCHQMVSPMTLGLLVRLLTGKLLVVNPHRSGHLGDIAVLTRRRPVTGRIRIGAARRWVDAFVCISQAIREELGSIGVPVETLWDIPNGVDLEHFTLNNPAQREESRQALNLPAGHLVLFTGRLAPEKGLDVLLSAWPQVLARVSDAYLILVGEGNQRLSLETQAQGLGLADRVLFVGGREDVLPYLKAADAFALPSYAEGLPVSLLEAMSCGLPCVATAVGGTSQLIRDGVTGCLVPVADSQALAQGLVQSLLAPEARQWGNTARQSVAQYYSLDAVADRHVAMYETLLRSRRP